MGDTTTGAIILVLVAALTIGSFWLLIYIYGLYCLGRRLAQIPGWTAHPTWSFIRIGLVAFLLASPLLSFKWDVIPLFATTFGAWLLHAQPTIVGFWAGLEIKQKADRELFENRAEEWLREWEEDDPPPLWLRDSLQ